MNVAQTASKGKQVVSGNKGFSTTRVFASHNRDLALRAIKSGLPIYPASATTKGALNKGLREGGGGRNAATTDVATVIDWWDRWPDAMPGMPTGVESGFVVLDIDAHGKGAFCNLLHELECEAIADLSPCYVETPGGGWHLWFKLEPDTSPRARANDIALGIDTRGLEGSIILPGSIRADGRRYKWKGGTRTFEDAPYMPRDLLYLATFNARERQLIAETSDLIDLRSEPAQRWREILERWRQEQVSKVADRTSVWADDDEGMRRQALADLKAVADELSSLTDNRRQKLFGLACRVAKYVHHKRLSEAEFLAALREATAANGSLTKHGAGWVASTLRSALVKSQGDALPPLARMYRTEDR